jgi:hypothetical protein
MCIYRSREKFRAEFWYEGSRLDTRSGFRSRKAAQDWLDEKRLAMKCGNAEQAPEFTFDALVAKFESHHMPTVRPLTRKSLSHRYSSPN